MINHTLPQGWQVKTLGEVCESISAGGDKPDNITETKTQTNKIPVYANGISNNGLLGYTDTATITKPALTISARGTIGFVCVRYEPYFPVVRLISAIPNKTILNLEFLRFALEFFIPKGEGSSIPQLTIPKFKQIKIPLPPLETQKAIVEKLENAFAHIDEAVRHLKSVQTNIPRLKSSLLHCAFSGKLTESQITAPTSTLSFSQRKSNPSPLPLTKEMPPFFCTKGEPAHSPLLAKNRAGGTTAPAFSDFSHHEVGAESHYDYHSEALAEESQKDSTLRDISATPRAIRKDFTLASKYDKGDNLPQGWELKTLGEVAKIKGGKRIPKGSKYADIPTQYPYIRVTDFENMSVNTKNLKYLTDEIQEKIKNYTISKDDVYISIAGSIGKVGIIPDELDKANLTENAAKIIHSMNKKYLAFYLNSNEIQSQISFLTKATTQPKLALNRIENLIIKIPPLATQNQIVRILESKFAHLEKLEQFVNASLENLQKLKSSLLNQAFKGEMIC